MDIALAQEKSTQDQERAFSKKADPTTPAFQSWINQVPMIYRDFDFYNLDQLPEKLVNFGIQISLNPISVFLHGEYGSGKTTFAYSLVKEILRNHFHIFAKFTTSRRLDSELHGAYQNGRSFEDYALQTYSEVDVLFIDDLDKVPISSRFTSNLFEIINCRMENKKITLITSNLALEEMGDIVNGSIVSRMKDTRFWKIVKFPKKDLRRESSSNWSLKSEQTK
jgi:DNA replication protein DnaC